MKPALDRGLRKFGRTVFQTIAGGSLTALVTLLADGLTPAQTGLVMAAWTALVAFLQNYLETAGKIPAFLPAPGLVTNTPGAVLDKVSGTVDVVVKDAGQVVTGTVDEMTEPVTGMVGETVEAVQGTVEAGGEFVGGVVGAGAVVTGQVLNTAGKTVGAVTGVLDREGKR